VTLIVGLDLGERRIGVAIAENGGPARALATLQRSSSVAGDVARLLRALPAVPEAVVVGLPLDLSGGEGPPAARSRAWADEAAALLPAPLVLRDERLTSHLAEQRLGPMKRGRSGGPPTHSQRRAYRERVDREAAAIILQDELDARAADAPVAR
jgi:putative Holliday junction resolvase